MNRDGEDDDAEGHVDGDVGYGDDDDDVDDVDDDDEVM